MNLIPGIEATGSALGAEKLRLNLIAQNIANANTTRTAEGGAYQRKVIAFEAIMAEQAGTTNRDEGIRSVRVSGIHNDPTPGRQVYRPGHPDANAEGYVTMPNVDVSREMVDLIVSSRSYEANLSVARTSRQIAEMTLSIGR